MRLRIFALDYDGTIARDGKLDPDVRASIEELRRRGQAVVLVTGRILQDLRAHLGSLRLFDAVVAENGAVVAFPQSGTSMTLAPPPPRAFLDALAARKVPFLAGQCLAEMDAGAAPIALELIRVLELPLVLHFNRGRMMVLPQAVSKATGLREALRALRLSPHNALAIGDAENDHELLSACEVGVAVGWGSEALQRAADTVLEGSGPAAVARFLRERASARRIDLSPRRRALLLGRDEAGAPAFLDLREGNVLIAGDPRSGKSWLGGLLAEQLVLQGYCVCVIDPEGDYQALGALPGVQLLGGDDALPSARELERLFAHPDASAVIDLSRTRVPEKPACVRSLLSVLASLRRRTGLPHRVLVDEAHYFLHLRPDEPAGDELDGFVLVSYQVSALHSDVLAHSDAVFVTRETDAREIRALRELCGAVEDEEHWTRTLAGLEIDEVARLPRADEPDKRLRRHRLAPRLTHHVRHEHKYLDVPMAEELAFCFSPPPGGAAKSARSLREFVEIVECASPAELDPHLVRGDFSSWVATVFRDEALAARLREIEEAHRLGRIADVNGALIHAVRQRYWTPEEASCPNVLA